MNEVHDQPDTFESQETNAFSFRGRVSQRTFVIRTLAPYAFVALAYVMARGEFQAPKYTIMWVTSIAASLLAGWVTTATWVKRWHDLGKSGWNALWHAITPINFFVWIHLARTAGQADANKYGDPPEETSL